MHVATEISCTEYIFIKIYRVCLSWSDNLHSTGKKLEDTTHAYRTLTHYSVQLLCCH